jgi:hypothetical protein
MAALKSPSGAVQADAAGPIDIRASQRPRRQPLAAADRLSPEFTRIFPVAVGIPGDTSRLPSQAATATVTV